MPRGIFCIETVWFGAEDYTSVRPMLQMLKDSFLEVPFVYRIAQTREEFILNLVQWKQLPANQFPILYLCYHGIDNHICFVGNDMMSVDEIREQLVEAGLCNCRLIHFASCGTINMLPEAVDCFLEETRACAISGYTETVHWMPSMAIDLLYFECLQDIEGLHVTRRKVRDSCATLLDDSATAHFCKEIGFRLFTLDA